MTIQIEHPTLQEMLDLLNGKIKEHIPTEKEMENISKKYYALLNNKTKKET